MSMGPLMPQEGIEATTDAIEQQVAAIKDESKALVDLTDEEAGVIDLRRKNAEATENLTEKTQKYKEEAKKLKAVAMGQGLAQAGEIFGKIADGFGQMSRELKDVNPELAETAGKAEHVATTLSSVASGAAGGFMLGGPAGALAGGITAAVIDLGKTWIDTYTSIKRIEAEAAERIEQTNRGIRERREELARAQGEAEASSFIDHLGAEADAYDEINAAVDRNIDLLRTKRNAELEVEDAKAGLEIAKIEGNAELSDEEKIRRKATVTEGLERKKVQAELDDLTDQFKASKSRSENASKESRGQDKKVEDIKAQIEKDEARARELNALPNRSGVENEELERARGAAERSRAQLPGEEARRDELRKSAKQALEAESTNRAKIEIEAKATIQRYGIEREARGEHTIKRAGQAREAAQREKKRKKQEADRQKEKEASQERGIGKDASGIAGKAENIAKKELGKSKGVEDLAKIRDALQEDPTAKELADLTLMLGKLVESLGKNGKDGSAISKLQREVTELQGKLRKSGDVQHNTR